MKAITIWQPWASLIMVGAKPFEFRPKSFLQYANAPAIGERVVIHAGARPIKPAEVEDLLRRLGADDDMTGLVVDVARQLLERVRAAHKYRGLPLAAGLGTAVLGKPRNAGTIFAGLPHDSDRGDFNWAWPLTDLQPFDAPVPARGFQGFWHWPQKTAIVVAVVDDGEASAPANVAGGVLCLEAGTYPGKMVPIAGKPRLPE